jgi:hypothetical protein
MCVMAMDLRGNYAELPLSAGPPHAATSYRVIGDTFVVTLRGSFPQRAWRLGLWTSLRRLITREYEGLVVSTYRFSHPSSDLILLHSGNHGVILELRRIPE